MLTRFSASLANFLKKLVKKRVFRKFLENFDQKTAFSARAAPQN